MTLSAAIIIESSYFGEIQLTLVDGHQYNTYYLKKIILVIDKIEGPNYFVE